MRKIDEIDFPAGVAERIITQFSISEENIEDMRDLIYFTSDLSVTEAKDLVNEIFEQVGI